MSEENKKNFVLNEEELDTVSGGATQNRYDPKRCSQITETAYECVGFLGATHCDHYRYEKRHSEGIIHYSHKCVMGRFNYTKYGTYDVERQLS